MIKLWVVLDLWLLLENQMTAAARALCIHSPCVTITPISRQGDLGHFPVGLTRCGLHGTALENHTKVTTDPESVACGVLGTF